MKTGKYKCLIDGCGLPQIQAAKLCKKHNSADYVLARNGWKDFPLGFRWQLKPESYVRIRTENGFPLEHRAIAEKALGRALPARAEVHHVNGCKHDNDKQNLVICPDGDYHMLLHRLTDEWELDTQCLLQA